MLVHRKAVQEYGKCTDYFDEDKVKDQKTEILDSVEGGITPKTMDMLMIMWREEMLSSPNQRRRRSSGVVETAPASMFANGRMDLVYELPDSMIRTDDKTLIVWPVQDDKGKL